MRSRSVFASAASALFGLAGLGAAGGCRDPDARGEDAPDALASPVVALAPPLAPPSSLPVRFDAAPPAAGALRSGAASCNGAPEPEDTAEKCSDACSNDGDRYVDCEDFDCAGVGACPARASRRCAGPRAAENSPARCSDGCSNDADDYVDCADFDCKGVGSCPS